MLRGMKRETVLALNALNQAFYTAVAAEWSARRPAWRGFERVFELACAPRLSASAAARQAGRTAEPVGRFHALDVGAGDGRFAAWLRARATAAGLGEDLEYCGVDASAPLLAYARARGLGTNYRFATLDFVAQPASLPVGPFALIALFGVLHHVASRAARLQLLADLAQRLAPGGTLALTIWRLDRDPRFAARVRSFSAYNARAAQPIDEADLEAGDRLLGWGHAHGPVRYCHFPDAAETAELIAAGRWPAIARFDADGQSGALNEYVLLRRP